MPAPTTSHEYKVRCTKLDAFSRGALEETLRVLSQRNAAQAALIEGIPAGPIIDKPAPHHGSEHTDVFSGSRVSKEDAAVIAEVFFELEAAAVDSEGKTTGLASHYAALSDAWSAFAEA